MSACTVEEFSALRTIIDRIPLIPDVKWQYASHFPVAEDFAGGSFLQRAGDNPQASFVIVKGAVRISESWRARIQSGLFMRGTDCRLDAFCDRRYSFEALYPGDAPDRILLRRASVLKLYDRNDCWNRPRRVSAGGALRRAIILPWFRGRDLVLRG